MAITVPFDLAYEFEVNAPTAEVFAVLADVPSSASHFPKVSKLVDLGKGIYRWEMEKVGTAKLNIQTIYASKYVADKKKGTVVWTPVAGELTVPLPGLMKALVAPFAISENEKLVEQYIANLCKAFGGEHGG